MLVEALAAWRAHPCPELAALVTRAGKLAAVGRDAITGTDHAALQKAWLAVEKQRDPADLDRLLATLTGGRCEAAIVRLGKLAKQPRDPRVLDKLFGILDGEPGVRIGTTIKPFTSDANRPFWTAMLKLIGELGDTSACARLREAAARPTQTAFERWLGGKLEKIATALDARTVAPLSAKERAVAAKLDAALAREESAAQPTADTGDALYEAVWAAPLDDAPRAVLADFLSDRNDPRGEFIVLQLARHAGTLDAAGKKREKELLKRHKKSWLGPIAPLIQPHALRFERGFLVTCQLEPDASLEKTLLAHPAWSTIAEYRVHGYSRKAKTHTKLVAMLTERGAIEIDGLFTRGIE